MPQSYNTSSLSPTDSIHPTRRWRLFCLFPTSILSLEIVQDCIPSLGCTFQGKRPYKFLACWGNNRHLFLKDFAAQLWWRCWHQLERQNNVFVIQRLKTLGCEVVPDPAENGRVILDHLDLQGWHAERIHVYVEDLLFCHPQLSAASPLRKKLPISLTMRKTS